METPSKQFCSKEQALEKLKHYCAYQERCHQEVKEKLYSLGLHKPDVEEIIVQLIEENYLNEERFATEYAGGKFRLKKWGRRKISYALKQKFVSEYCIRKALQQIDDKSYVHTLLKLTEEKWKTLRGEKNFLTRKRKTMDYLLQKGYENGLIQEALTEMKGRE